MASEKNKKAYSLEFDKADFESKINRADFYQSIDAASELKVHFALQGKSKAELKPSSFPQQATFKAYERGVFKGELVQVQTINIGLVECTYRDSFHNLNRKTESDYFKGVSLKDFLSRAASMAQLSAVFHGDFDAVLPSFNVTGVPIQDHIKKISYPYGFVSSTRSYNSEIFFSKLNQVIKDSKVTSVKENAIVSARWKQNSETLLSAGELRFFNSAKKQSEKKELNLDALYSPLGYLKEGTSFRARSQKTSSQRREERLAMQLKQYEEGAEWLANEVSKQALGQEQLELSLYSLPALTGETLALPEGILGTAEGKYLVQTTEISIASHQPKVCLTLVRA